MRARSPARRRIRSGRRSSSSSPYTKRRRRPLHAALDLCLLHGERPVDAIESLTTAAQLDPGATECLQHLALAHLATGEINKAAGARAVMRGSRSSYPTTSSTSGSSRRCFRTPSSCTIGGIRATPASRAISKTSMLVTPTGAWSGTVPQRLLPNARGKRGEIERGRAFGPASPPVVFGSGALGRGF